MAQKYSLSDLGLSMVRDLCVLDPNPPPISFAGDLGLATAQTAKPEQAIVPRDPTYWQAASYNHGGPSL